AGCQPAYIGAARSETLRASWGQKRWTEAGSAARLKGRQRGEKRDAGVSRGGPRAVGREVPAAPPERDAPRGCRVEWAPGVGRARATAVYRRGGGDAAVQRYRQFEENLAWPNASPAAKKPTSW